MKDKELEQVHIRLIKGLSLMSEHRITSPEDAIEVIGRQLLSEIDREALCVINLQGDGKPINFNVVSIGTVNKSLAVPIEILKSAILSNASSVIMLHNHPSNNLVPSKNDMAATRKIISSCNALGIGVLDHIIVGGNNTENYYSMHEQKIIDFKHCEIDNSSELKFVEPEKNNLGVTNDPLNLNEQFYEVEIQETLARTVPIKAGSMIEAVRIAEELYNSEAIVLDSSDFIDKQIQCKGAVSEEKAVRKNRISKERER